MGLGFEKSKQKSTTSAESFIDPTQQPHLENIYNQAQTLGSAGMPVEGTARLNPNLTSALRNQTAAGKAIAGAGTGMMSAGTKLADGSNQALNYATGAMGGNITPTLDAGAQFADMGRFGNINPNISGPNTSLAKDAGGLVTTAGTTTNTGLNPNDLSRYINNDVLSDQIGAVGRDITRNLTEQVKPTIAANAAVTGNSGSSRRAVQDAIAERGAADRMADVAAQMRGNAYNAGLGFESQRASQNAQLGQSGRQFDAGARNQLTGQGLGIAGNQAMREAELQQQKDQFSAEQYNRLLDSGMGRGLQNQQFGAQMAGDIGRQGYDNMQRGADILRGGIGDQRDAGEFQRAYDQALLNQEYRQDMAGMQGLQFYRDMVGPPTELNKSDSTTTKKSKGFNLG